MIFCHEFIDPGYTTQENATPVMTEVVNYIDFNWGQNGRPHKILTTAFSAEFSGFITPSLSGEYVFFVAADDDVELIVDGLFCVKEKYQAKHAHAWHKCIRNLVKDKPHPFELHYAQHGGDAYVKLHWESLENGIHQQAIPPIHFFYLHNELF